jgi:hypothetical protein
MIVARMWKFIKRRGLHLVKFRNLKLYERVWFFYKYYQRDRGKKGREEGREEIVTVG